MNIYEATKKALQKAVNRKEARKIGHSIYKEISRFVKIQRNEIRKEKQKKKNQVCIDPDSVIGKEIMYQTALLHEILEEIRGGKPSP